MNSLSSHTPWFALGAIAIAAWAQGTYGWGTSWYQHGIWVAACASIIAAYWVLKSARWSWTSVVVVAIVLLVANYTLVEGLAVLAIWSVSGFAP